jgi:phage-related protein
LSDKSLKGKKLEGSHQLTIKHRDSYRVVYVAQDEEFIVVLHSFKKKTEGKATKEMHTVESRLAKLKADIKAGNI